MFKPSLSSIISENSKYENLLMFIVVARVIFLVKLVYAAKSSSVIISGLE